MSFIIALILAVIPAAPPKVAEKPTLRVTGQPAWWDECAVGCKANGDSMLGLLYVTPTTRPICVCMKSPPIM
jgi:hypothetical protein